MRMESLMLFLDVAECGSLARAAKKNFISQQGASSAIRGIEQDFGLMLFNRTAAGLQLTSAGRRFAKGVERVVQSYRSLQFMAAAQGDGAESGLLRIVTMPFITNRLADVFSGYEAIADSERLFVQERSFFDIVESFVASQGASVAPDARLDDGSVLCLIAIPSFMRRIVERTRPAFSALVSCEMMAACSWDCSIAEHDRVTREELCSLPLACYNEDFLNRIIGHMFKGFYPDIRLNTSNLDMLNRAVAERGMVTFADSLSVYLGSRSAPPAYVPIADSVFFTVGILGHPREGTQAARFAAFFRRYLATACAPYMERYVCADWGLR